VINPAQDVQRGITKEYVQSRCYLEHNTAKVLEHVKKQLQVDAHTEERLIPPVMITINKCCLFRFQPQKRCQFNLFNENGRNGCVDRGNPAMLMNWINYSILIHNEWCTNNT